MAHTHPHAARETKAEVEDNFFLVNTGRYCRAGRTAALFHNSPTALSAAAVFSTSANWPAAVPSLRTREPRERRRRGGGVKNKQTWKLANGKTLSQWQGRVQADKSTSEWEIPASDLPLKPRQSKYLLLPKTTAFHLKNQINFQCCQN